MVILRVWTSKETSHPIEPLRVEHYIFNGVDSEKCTQKCLRRTKQIPYEKWVEN
jgi:hypothetical protein